MKKLRASDWLKTSTFFMSHECDCHTMTERARLAKNSSVLTYCDAFFM